MDWGKIWHWTVGHMSSFVWLLVGIVSAYLVRPFMNILYPMARFQKRIVIVLDGSAALYISQNRLSLPIVNIMNHSLFDAIVSRMTANLKVDGTTVSITEAEQMPAEIRRGKSLSSSLLQAEITQLGRQRISEIRNNLTDCIDFTVSLRAVMRTFYDETVITRDIGLRVRVFN